MMKYILSSILLALLMMSCSPATSIVASIKSTDDAAKSFEKLAILSLFPQMSSRATIELAMEKKMRELDIPAITTYDLFPFAGNKEVMDKMNLSGEELRTIVREKVKTNKIDALMTISLLDAKQEERYVEGSTLTVSGPSLYAAYPQYNFAYYDYYSYAYTTVHNGGYYETTTTYFIEINLYDIESEKLIWTGQTKTKDPSHIETEAANLSSLVVNELFTKEVLKR